MPAPEVPARRVLITGSSSGIGHALAGHFLRRGDRIWGIARSAQAAPAGAPARGFRSSRGDVSSRAAVEACAAEVASAWGGLDALILCAGSHGAVGPALALDPDAWSETVRTNLNGAYFPLRLFRPLLRPAAGRAKVVCFSGGGATKGRANFSAYAAAKTAIVRLVETIAVEEREASLDINAVAPGTIHTRLSEEMLALGPGVVGAADYQAALKQKQDGAAAMAKVIALVDWLASPSSDGITGRLLSAPWDPWPALGSRRGEIEGSDIYTLRRIGPEDRGKRF